MVALPYFNPAPCRAGEGVLTQTKKNKSTPWPPPRPRHSPPPSASHAAPIPDQRTPATPRALPSCAYPVVSPAPASLILAAMFVACAPMPTSRSPTLCSCPQPTPPPSRAPWHYHPPPLFSPFTRALFCWPAIRRAELSFRWCLRGYARSHSFPLLQANALPNRCCRACGNVGLPSLGSPAVQRWTDGSDQHCRADRDWFGLPRRDTSHGDAAVACSANSGGVGCLSATRRPDLLRSTP